MARSTSFLKNMRALSIAFAASATLNGASVLAAPADSTSSASSSASTGGPAHLSGVTSLVAAVPQTQQDGNSTLGTLNAPQLPAFLTGPGIPLPQGFPWGSSNIQTNPYTSPPNTGVTKYYDFTISNVTLKPDGVPRDMLVVNGQFPGPTIEANWGDEIQVTVHNNLPTEGTALHWHGLLQQGTPWEDGVPGVSQCPIAPGSSFTYRFKADLYGSSWYHSHYSAQYNAGLEGPMIIHGPKNVNYDIDLGPVMLSDWYHTDYFEIVEQVMNQNQPPPKSNNNLINGKMNYPCANTTLPCTPNAGISKFTFQSGKLHRLRLVNSGSEGVQQFSIDDHELIVMANDFVPVQPYTTKIVTLGVGQRTDVIVNATGKPTDSYWMRSNLNPNGVGCSLNDGVSPQAVAAIYYQKASTTAQPNSTMDVTLPGTCANDPLSQTVPFKSIAPQPVSKTIELDINAAPNGTSFLFTVNNQTFRDDYNDPTLLEAKLGNLTFAPERNVYNVGENGSVIFIVRNFFGASHPMHMHGHNFYILNEGFGDWDGKTVINPSNPQRRDVHLLAPAQGSTPAYIVVQFDLDNPGVWPFHCHIAWHVSAGLYINILERPNDITFSSIPSVMAQTCRDWSAFTGTHIPDQIDSGL
ncbi:MAG: hypothetical protein M1821_007153 [Bathelium mastoideum]|nr:MAG: hypothetical protein M1821_007153 [Bathelium mastoideum]KAI9694663.1 MAG: hypothetical protein M1822_000279 [Bathelium mastoideum]